MTYKKAKYSQYYNNLITNYLTADLVPYGFYVFSKLNGPIKGKRFEKIDVLNLLNYKSKENYLEKDKIDINEQINT